jgi:hypothetical protein
MSSLHCPNCHNHSDFIMHEDPRVFDGVLVFQCEACRTAWPRFSPDFETRYEAGVRLAEKLNAARDE